LRRRSRLTPDTSGGKGKKHLKGGGEKGGLEAKPSSAKGHTLCHRLKKSGEHVKGGGAAKGGKNKFKSGGMKKERFWTSSRSRELKDI